MLGLESYCMGGLQWTKNIKVERLACVSQEAASRNTKSWEGERRTSSEASSLLNTLHHELASPRLLPSEHATQQKPYPDRVGDSKCSLPLDLPPRGIQTKKKSFSLESWILPQKRKTQLRYAMGAKRKGTLHTLLAHLAAILGRSPLREAGQQLTLGQSIGGELLAQLS